jgi:cobalt/nickel transport system ATP-binding protein
MEYCIEIANLRYTYPDGREALKGVNLSVREGEKLALVGPNGAGKSTLMLLLTGLLDGDGRIRVFGDELGNGGGEQARARMGLVFQNPDDQLFSPTVFDDVAFGPLYAGLSEEEVRQRVSVALSQVGLDGFENRLSHHLSIGEKKRVAIATVLSMQPQVLVFDEPTAGLDPRARRMLIELLRRLDQTLLIATHDMWLVEDLLPRTVVLNHGEIVADGDTGQLLSDEGLLLSWGLR